MTKTLKMYRVMVDKTGSWDFKAEVIFKTLEEAQQYIAKNYASPQWNKHVFISEKSRTAYNY